MQVEEDKPDSPPWLVSALSRLAVPAMAPPRPPPPPPAKKKPWSTFNSMVLKNATPLTRRETMDPNVGAVIVDVYGFSLVSVLAVHARQLSSPSTADQAAAAVVDLCAKHVLDMVHRLHLKPGAVVHLLVDGPPVLSKGRWARGSEAERARALNRALRQSHLPGELFAPHQRRSALATLRERIFRSKHVFTAPFCARVAQGVDEGLLVELHECTGEADGQARLLARDFQLKKIPFVLASCDRDLLYSAGITCERYIYRNKGKIVTVTQLEALAKEAARSTLLGDSTWLKTLAPVHFHLLLGLVHELSGSDTSPTDPGVTPISVWRKWGGSLASCVKTVTGDGSRVVLGGTEANSLSATRAFAMWLESDPPISRSVALAVLDAVAVNVDIFCPAAERSRLTRRSNGQPLAVPGNVFSSLFGDFVDATKADGSHVRARLRAKLHGDTPAKKKEKYSRHVNSFVVTTNLRPALNALVGMSGVARSSSATKTTKTWSTGVSRRAEMRRKQASAWTKRRGDIEAFVESVGKMDMVAGAVWSVSTDRLGEADGIWAALEPEPGLRSSPKTVTIKVTVGEDGLTSKWPIAGSGRYHLRVGVTGPDTAERSFVSTEPVVVVHANPVPVFAKAGHMFAPASRVAAPSSGKKRQRKGRGGGFASLRGAEVPKLVVGAGIEFVDQPGCELWDENFNPIPLSTALPHVTVTAVDGSAASLPQLAVGSAENHLVLSVGADCQGTYHFRNANGGYLGGVVVKRSAPSQSSPAPRASRAIVKKTMVTQHGMVTLPLGSLTPLWPVERDRQVVRQFVYDLLRDRATVHLTLATKFLSLCTGDGEFSSSSLPPHTKKSLDAHMSAVREEHGKWETDANCALDFVQSIQGDIAGNAAVAVRQVLRDAMFEAFRGEVEALDRTKTLDRPSVHRFLDQLTNDLLGSEDEEEEELSGEVESDPAGDGTGGPPKKRRVGRAPGASPAPAQSRDWSLRKHPLRAQLTALANNPPATLTARFTAALATNGLSPSDVPSLSSKEGGGFAQLDLDVTTKLLLIVAYNRRSPTARRRVRQKVFAVPSQEGSSFAHVGLFTFRKLCKRLLACRRPEERAGWTETKVHRSPWESLVAEFAPGLTRVLDAKNARGSRFVFAQALRLSVAGARICVHELGTLQASSTDSTAVQQRGDEVRKVNSRSWRSLDRPAGKSMLRVLLDADQPHLIALRHVSDGVGQSDVRDILSQCVAVGIDPGLKNVTDMVVGQLTLDENGLVAIDGDIGRIPSAAVQPLRAGAGPYVDAPGEPRVDDEAVRDFGNDVRNAALKDAHERPDSFAQALARAAKRNASFAGKERADHFILQTVVSKVAQVRELLAKDDDCPVIVFIGAGGYSAKATKHNVAGYTAFQLAKLLRRRFTTIVVPEFLTSQGCPGCGAKLIRGSGPSWRSRTCPSPTCSLHHSEYTKDQTAALAILRIGVDQLLTGVRPACFTDQVPWYAGTVT